MSALKNEAENKTHKDATLTHGMAGEVEVSRRPFDQPLQELCAADQERSRGLAKAGEVPIAAAKHDLRKKSDYRVALRDRVGERSRYTGTFVRMGTKAPHKMYSTVPIPTVLLRDVTDHSGCIVTDHLWFNETKGLASCCLKAGDIVEFYARVSTYEKGYRGYREDVYKPCSFDYRLERPTRVKVLSRASTDPCDDIVA
jgi:hypothetical protein